MADHCGRIAPGQDADLVIWDGDPLEPASAPVAVFVQGREVSLRTRQTALRDRYAPAWSADPGRRPTAEARRRSTCTSRGGGG